MKKTKILVAAVVTMIISSASIAYAKFHSDTLIIGGNAFDIEYVFDKKYVGEVNKCINSVNGTDIYYIDSSGKIKNIFSPTTWIKEKDLNGGKDILYKSRQNPDGVNYKVNGEEFCFFDRPIVKFNVSLGSIEGNKFIVTCTYNEFYEGDNDSNKILAQYIKFEGLDKMNLNDKKKKFIILTSDRKIPFKILDSYEKELCVGQIDLSTMRVGANGDKVCELYKLQGKSKLEISCGNIQNCGEAMLAGESFYYINSSDSGKLYKSKIDGSENKLLSEDKPKYMCSVGDYIYYSNMADGGKLYRIKNDGSDREKLYDGLVSYIDKTSTDVYFIDGSNGNRIYKVPISGGKVEQVNDDTADSLAVIDGDVYYVNKNDSNKLHKINTVPSSLKVFDLSVRKFIGKNSSNMIICTTDGCVYKYDGGTPEKIDLNIPNYNDTREDRAYSINVIGDYVYYKSINDGGKLYRVNSKGGNAELVVPYPVDNIYVVDSENLYFTQGSRMNKLNVSMDFSGKMNFLVTPTSRENTKSVIKIIDDLRGTGALKLPSKVKIEFNDHTQDSIPAYWDTNKPQLVGDETIYTGTLLGGAKVQYRHSENSLDIDNAKVKKNIIRNFNGKYTLILSEGGIKAGDLIRIYTDDTSSAIAQQNVGRDGKVIFNNLTGVAGSKICATRKENGKTESKIRQAIIDSIQLEPKINSVFDNENAFNGADGRDITIKLDENPLSVFTSKEVYIIPKGRFVDLVNSKGLKGYALSDDTLWNDNKDGSYTGKEKITTDSIGNMLNNGLYDVYLVGINGIDKYCSDGKSVLIKSESPAAFMTPEVIGDKFKAHNCISDAKVKLNVRAVNGSIINDITTNYDMNIMLNGEILDKNKYSIENNNSIVLKESFLNTLNCGSCKFEVILIDKSTSKSINSLFNVVVDSAAEYKTIINTSIFTKGYSPESVEVSLTGKDINGQTITESQLRDSVILVNDKPIANFTIKDTSIVLQKKYLDTLESGEYTINIVNKEIDLNEKVNFKITDSQAELTPIIEGKYDSFKTGQAKNDIIVSLNAKDEQGKTCDFDGIEVYYDGTRLPNTMYKLENNKLTLYVKLLNQLSCGDKEIIIKGKIKETSKIIEGKLKISVLPAAELKLMLRETDKNKFIIGSFQDLTYDVIEMDENNKSVDRSKIDLSNVKLQKGSNELIKDNDYYVDNINKTIKLKKRYLDTLIAGDTAITVNVGGLSKDIIVTAEEGQPEISARIKNLEKYSFGSADSDMNIELTGILSKDVVRVEIIPIGGTSTYLNKDIQYTLDETKNIVSLTKNYLNGLSAKCSKYEIVISDANKSARATFEVKSVAKFKFKEGKSDEEFVISSLTSGLTAKILEEDCDGKPIKTDLTSTTLKLTNKALDLRITEQDYEIKDDSIIIKQDFLEKLLKGDTEVEVYKDGIVTPAKFILKK